LRGVQGQRLNLMLGGGGNAAPAKERIGAQKPHAAWPAMQRREPAPARVFRARASQTGESLITRQSCQGHAEEASPRLRLAMQRRLETQHPDGISSKTLAAKVVSAARVV